MSPVTDHDEIAAWLARVIRNSALHDSVHAESEKIAAELAPHVAAQIEAATAAERSATVKFLKPFQVTPGELLAQRIEKGKHL